MSGRRCLRNHIPLGAPATREPCTGDEPRIRVSLGFTPRWYRTRLGIDFAGAWHTDPHYRYDSLLSMKRQFSGTRRAVMYSPVRLEEASLSDIWADIERLDEDLAPCDFVMADVESTTPDERVRELLRLVSEVTGEPAA